MSPLWMMIILLFHVCQFTTGDTSPKEMLLARLKHQLRLSSPYQRTGEIWLKGAEVQIAGHECLAADELLSDAGDIDEFESGRPEYLRVKPTQRRIFEFTFSPVAPDDTNDDPSASSPPFEPLAAAAGRVLSSAVWFPNQIIRSGVKIRIVRCIRKNSVSTAAAAAAAAAGNSKSGKVYILKEKQYRRIRKGHSGGGSSSAAREGRFFDVTSLFNGTDSQFGYIAAIVDVSTSTLSTNHKRNNNHSVVAADIMPFLHTTYTEPQKKQSKKLNSRRPVTTRLCDDDSNTTEGLTTTRNVRRCCLRTFQVDFVNIGWHWVDEPKSMQIHYCEGYCPHPYGGASSETSQGTFLTFIRGARPAVGQLCCIASAYHRRHVSVRTPRIGRTVIRSLEDLDAASCACLS